MSRWIRPPLWIIAHIRIRVLPTRIRIHRIRPYKTATDRVVVTEVVVEQACLAVKTLPREIVRGGHRTGRVAYRTIGGEELRRLRGAIVFERHSAAAQAVGEQVVQHAVPVHRDLLPVDTVVFDGGGRATGDACLSIAIKGDGISGCRGAVGRCARRLQHGVARVVIQETIAGRRTT